MTPSQIKYLTALHTRNQTAVAKLWLIRDDIARKSNERRKTSRYKQPTKKEDLGIIDLLNLIVSTNEANRVIDRALKNCKL